MADSPPAPPERTLEERWREPFAVEVSGSIPQRAPQPSVVVVDETAADGVAPPAEPDPAPVRSEPAVSPRTHRVSAGETLSGLARRYGVSVARLREVNDLPDDTIRVGQTLRIPAS